MSSDSINLRQLKPDTLQALANLCSRKGWADLYGYGEPEQIAWLSFLLEFVDDSEEVFPRGKWATIQRLQDLVREAARRESCM